MRSARVLAFSLLLALPLRAGVTAGVRVHFPQGALRGFPSLLDEQGGPLADSELNQWIEGGKLHVRLRSTFADGRVSEERSVFSQGKNLVQESWSYAEVRGEEELRRFEIDFRTRHALARKREGDERKHWDEEVDVKAGSAFAGYGIAIVAENLLAGELQRGPVQIRTVAFTPKPRAVTLELRTDGEETLSAGGRELPATRVVIHPDLPFPIGLIAGAKDAHLWFYRAAKGDPPPALLRAEQPLAEAKDPTVRVEVFGRPPAAPQARGKSAPRPQREPEVKPPTPPDPAP